MWVHLNNPTILTLLCICKCFIWCSSVLFCPRIVMWLTVQELNGTTSAIFCRLYLPCLKWQIIFLCFPNVNKLLLNYFSLNFTFQNKLSNYHWHCKLLKKKVNFYRTFYLRQFFSDLHYFTPWGTVWKISIVELFRLKIFM